MRRAHLPLLLSLLACEESRSPGDLRHPQILAVRLEPPELRAGGRARLDLLASDAEGVPAVMAPALAELAPDPTGTLPPLPAEAAAAFGITTGAEGAFVDAPDEAAIDALASRLGLAAGAPLRASLRVTVMVAGELRRADKFLTVLRAAGTEPVANPAIHRLAVDGLAWDLAPREVARGAHQLSATADEAGPLSFSWYSAVGQLKGYRSRAATLAADRPDEGAVVLVVRTERGGVAWRSSRLVVR
jgi:hypothetical protein